MVVGRKVMLPEEKTALAVFSSGIGYTRSE
jgi:hypothetical protein